MRTVVNSAQVAHLWAHKVQAEAHNSGRSLYFNCGVIYSFGSHFPIARHVENKAHHAVLFTTATYSHTTARHCFEVRQAISHLTVFNVPDVFADSAEKHRANLADYAKRITALLLQTSKSIKAEKKQYRHGEALELRAEAVQYAEFFGLAYKRILPEVPAIDSAELADMKKREAKRLADERAKTLKDNAKKIERWRAGESVSLPHGLPDMLRVVTRNAKDDPTPGHYVPYAVVQTSRHAEFPVAHAKRALALVRAVRECGEPWQTNGHTMHLGPFKVDRIEANGDVQAGCHFVKWEEIERVAPQLDAIETIAEPISESV